ncbi:MAG: hypothetical protein ABIK73_00395 [candidate division WOR-3 bacterium]
MKYIDPEDLLTKLHNRYLAINLAAQNARNLIAKLNPKRSKIKDNIFDLEGISDSSPEETEPTVTSTEQLDLSLDYTENIYIAAIKEVLKKYRS